jgi:hypothetical protein
MIAWEVTGSPTLTLTPKLSGAQDGPVATNGRVMIKPTAKTRVSLRVTRLGGEPTGADVDVDVPEPVEVAADLNDAALCENGILTLETDVKGFSPGVMAKRMGGAKRPLDIRRLDSAGKIATDSAGNPIVAHLEHGGIGIGVAVGVIGRTDDADPRLHELVEAVVVVLRCHGCPDARGPLRRHPASSRRGGSGAASEACAEVSFANLLLVRR